MGPHNRLWLSDYGCHFEPLIVSTFSFWTEIKKVYFKCELINKPILAQYANSLIFDHKCKIKDLFCKLHDSMVVWHEECKMRRDF
jgi:hypothetical protein